MTRKTPCGGFTLIEMITVMAVIAILASIVLAVNSFVQNKSSRIRANTEIEALKAALASYKADNGSVPRKDEVTENGKGLNPVEHVNPASGKDRERYVLACRELYEKLNGDDDRDGRTDKDRTSYAADFFSPNRVRYDSTGSAKKVDYLQDPFGNCFGYSTEGSRVEEDYRKELRADASAARPTISKCFGAEFDLWSTGGTTKMASGGPDYGKWVKTW